MLLVTVRSRLVQVGAVSRNDNGSARDFDYGDLCVSIRTGSLFGFWHKIDNAIVAGESCFPLKGDDISLFEEGIRDGVPLEQLLGDRMLVLVLIDLSRRVATIAHSIASSRPCYLSIRPGFFSFSTSVSGLKEVGNEVAWNSDCTPEYLLYRFVAPSRSILRGVRKLAGGQLIAVNLDEGLVQEDRQWHWPEEKGIDPEADVANFLRPRIAEWLHRFPKAGILLSGGLDSSLLAGLARVTHPNVQTFSTSFSFANADDGEAQYALSMAHHLGLNHQVHNTTPERYLTGWVQSIHAAEEPVHHLQSVLLHILFQDRAEAGHGAILCGEGADCIVGNAFHQFLYRYRTAVGFLRTTNLGSVWAPLADALGWHGTQISLLTRLYDRRLSSAHHFLWLLGQSGDREIIQRLLSCDDAALLGERPCLLDAYHDRSLLDQVTALALLSEAHTTISIWSKLAEASGLYLACPYTSPSVLAAVTAVPWNVKLQEMKHLVRAALRELDVPETFITRQKLSFGFPARFWALKGALFQPIVDMARRVHGADVLESLQREEAGASMVLWGLLNQFLWMQLFEAGRSVEDLSGEIIDRHRAAMGSR